MMGLWEMARQIAETLTRRTGTPVLAGQIENPAYPCCLAEVSGETELGSRQIRRRVQVTLTCYPSSRRGREEGMRLMDALERAAAEGFALGERKLCPAALESEISSSQLPQVRFSLEFYDTPGGSGAEGGGEIAEKMGSLSLTMETEKEE